MPDYIQAEFNQNKQMANFLNPKDVSLRYLGNVLKVSNQATILPLIGSYPLKQC